MLDRNDGIGDVAGQANNNLTVKAEDNEVSIGLGITITWQIL